jgi:hypothetical protein
MGKDNKNYIGNNSEKGQKDPGHDEICSVEAVEKYQQQGHQVRIVRQEGDIYMMTGPKNEFENRVPEGHVYAHVIWKNS